MPVQRTKRRASAWLRRDMLSCGKIRRRRREQHTPLLRLNAGRYRLPGNYRSRSATICLPWYDRIGPWPRAPRTENTMNAELKLSALNSLESDIRTIVRGNKSPSAAALCDDILAAAATSIADIDKLIEELQIA